MMTDDEMQRLKSTFLAPYIYTATALIGKTREGGGNMFRHQMNTLAILIDYSYIDSILLKASIIHDLIEDIPEYNRNLILQMDFESPAVYDLVMEVTRNPEESKPDYLTRLCNSGSDNAKILKVADRISNMIELGYVINTDFIHRYTEETVKYIYPIAEQVNRHMLFELECLVESRRKYLSAIIPGKEL